MRWALFNRPSSAEFAYDNNRAIPSHILDKRRGESLIPRGESLIPTRHHGDIQNSKASTSYYLSVQDPIPSCVVPCGFDPHLSRVQMRQSPCRGLSPTRSMDMAPWHFLRRGFRMDRMGSLSSTTTTRCNNTSATAVSCQSIEPRITLVSLDGVGHGGQLP